MIRQIVGVYFIRMILNKIIKEMLHMKRFYSLVLTITLALSLSLPVHAETDQLPFIKSGYTEEGIYYEVHGEALSQYRSISQTVTRQVTYEGDVTPPKQLLWEETIHGITYTGTLQLTTSIYTKGQTIASYRGVITAKPKD